MDDQQYSVSEIATTAQTPRRTIRYYVQLGLIPPPHGSGKGAKYDAGHLERLLKIRRLQADGFSLERIARLLDEPAQAAPAPSAGELRVVSRLTLAPGLTLEIDPETSGLTPDEVRELSRQCMNNYAALRRGGDDNDNGSN